MKVKKLLAIALAGVLMLGTVACSSKSGEEASGDAAEKTKVVIGTSAQYPPWAFQKDDELTGFEMDVWNEIAKRNNYELEYKLGQFSGLVGMLDAGEIDTVAHQMSITPEREEKYNFSEPYAYSYYDLFVKEDSPFQTKEDLKGKKVGCWLGGNGEATLRAINDEHQLGFDIVTYDGVPMEDEVNLGRIDALWQGEIKTKTTVEEKQLPIRQLNEKLTYEVNAYPFRKDEQGEKLAKEVGATLKEMREDGTLKKLSEKWFEIDTTEPQE